MADDKRGLPDLTDDLLTDITPATVSKRSSTGLPVSYAVSGIPSGGSGLGVDGNTLNENPVDQSGVSSLAPDIDTTLHLKWGLVTPLEYTLSMKWGLASDATPLLLSLGMKWEQGLPSTELIFDFKYQLLIGTPSALEIRELNMSWGITGVQHYVDVRNELNLLRAADGKVPYKLYVDNNQPSGPIDLAWKHSYQMFKHDQLENESLDFDTGLQTLEDSRLQIPEQADAYGQLITAYPMPLFPTAASLVADLAANQAALDVINTAWLDLEGEQIPGETYFWIGWTYNVPSPALDLLTGNPQGTRYAWFTISFAGLNSPGEDGMSQIVLTLKHQLDVFDTMTLHMKVFQDAYTPVVAQVNAPYGLNVAAQHSAPSEVRVAAQHGATTYFGLAAQHTAIYTPYIPVTTQHEGLYDLDQYNPVVAQHELSYDLIQDVVASHTAPYEGLTVIAAQLEGPYGELGVIAAQHQADYSELGTLAAQHQADYSATNAVVHQHEAQYALAANDFVVGQHRAYYAMQEGLLVSAAIQQKLVYNGIDMPVSRGWVSMSEGDAAWSFEAELLEVGDYQTIKRGQPITLNLEGELYELIVESKDLTRNGPADVTMSVKGSSRVVLKEAPYAPQLTKSYETNLSAQVIVEDLLGESVDWSIDTWTIPAFRVAVNKGSPVELAQRIAEAGGGVLESKPDGTLKVRRKFPVTVPDYDIAAPDHVFTDVADNISVSEGFRIYSAYNSFRVRDEEVDKVSSKDTLDYLANEDPLTGGTVRAYPGPWRLNVKLDHTWDASIGITDTGIQTRQETEVVEFVAGEGSTRYPVFSIDTVEWESLVLSGLVFETHVSGITTANTEDYGLAIITYTVQSLDYTVTQPIDTDVQFTLENT